MSATFSTTLRRFVGTAAWSLLAACLPARPVTVGETQVGQGLLYQSSNLTYDRFFEETHAVQVAAMGALDEQSKAVLLLEQALGVSRTTPEQLADLVKTRAKKIESSSNPMHLTITGLPEKVDSKTNVTAVLSVADEGAIPPSERDFHKGLEQAIKSECDLIDKYAPLAGKARALAAQSVVLLRSAYTDFTVESRRAEVSEELGAAKLILNAVAERADKVSVGGVSFLKIVAQALPPPGPETALASKADSAGTKPKKNGAKPPAAPKPKPEAAPKPKAEPAPKPKPEVPPKPKPEPAPESAKPAPPPKPAPEPAKPAEDFNP